MHPMDSAQALLREIDAFLDQSGMTQTKFGIEVMNNSSFVRQLRNGGSVTLRTQDRVRAFINGWDKKKKTRQTPRESHAA